jgi:hypothetical protein
MRFLLVAVVSMLPLCAHAQSCQVVGNQTQCDIGTLNQRNGSANYWSEGKSAGPSSNSYFSSDGSSYNRLGDNSRVYNNGTVTQSYGNTTYLNDGRICQRFAGQVTCN